MIDRLLTHIREHGLARTAAKAAAALVRVVRRGIHRTHVELLLEFDLAAPPMALPATRLVVRDMVPGDIEDLKRFIRLNNVHASYGLKRLAYNLAHDYRGVLALLDGEIVGYGWWMDRSHSHPAQRLHGIHLGKTDIYSFDLFVAPTHRGQHIALEFVIRGQDLVRQRGWTRILSNVLETNRRSLLVHRQAGFRELDRHRVHTLFNAILLCGRTIAFRNPLWF